MDIPILKHIKSRITAPFVQENQRMQAHYESELAAKDVTIAELKNSVAHHENREKSFAARVQWVERREHEVEQRAQLVARSVDNIVAEREHALECRERELECKERSLFSDYKKAVDRGVEERFAKEIGHKEKELKERERIVNRQSRNYVYRLNKCDEREKKMYERAQQLADYLGVSPDLLLTRQEKNHFGKTADKLTEDRRALIDMAMTCPEEQINDLLTKLQLFRRNHPKE